MKKWIIYIFSLGLGVSAFASIPKHKPGAFPEGEKLIYSKFLASFRKSDLTDMNKQKKLLEENYPTSVHLENAYYLTGAIEYQQDHLGEALRAFDKVVNTYPQSSRRSSALFAMGMTYKKLNLTKQAQAVFQRVVDNYPGSPESQRAWLESRIPGTTDKTTKTK